VDSAGRAQVHYAALNDDVAQVVELLAGGADPDAADIQGFTALHFACRNLSTMVCPASGG
jgi:ankyrin repeat protein